MRFEEGWNSSASGEFEGFTREVILMIKKKQFYLL